MICRDCGKEEALPGVDVGPICLDLLRHGDDADRQRARRYEESLAGKDDPDVKIGED